MEAEPRGEKDASTQELAAWGELSATVESLANTATVMRQDVSAVTAGCAPRLVIAYFSDQDDRDVATLLEEALHRPRWE